MKKLLLSLAALLVFALPSVALADVFTFNAPSSNNEATGPGSGSNQVDLDHHRAYAWRINNGSTAGLVGAIGGGQTLTSATLTFRSMRNWDNNPNRLFISLLDNSSTTAGSAQNVNSGGHGTIRYVTDVNPNQAPVTEISDYFATANVLTNGNASIALTSQSFDDSFPANLGAYPLAPGWSYNATTGDYTYTLTAGQLGTFSAYLLNGSNFAFGLDPDCHFWNNGITFTVNTHPGNPIPEPTTMALLGTGLAGLYARRRRQQKKAQNNS